MKKLLLLLFAVIATTTFAQNKINFEQGNFDFLKDQKEVNVKFVFDNVAFHEKNLTEAQYLENRKADITAKKGQNTWDSWNTQWEKYKASEFLDFFIKGINGKSKKVYFRSDVKTKYTLIIDTKWLYAGWYGGFMGTQPAKLTANLTFVETDNPSNVVMKLVADKIEGNKGNDDLNWEYGRMGAAYEITGKKLAKEINAVVK